MGLNESFVLAILLYKYHQPLFEQQLILFRKNRLPANSRSRYVACDKFLNCKILNKTNPEVQNLISAVFESFVSVKIKTIITVAPVNNFLRVCLLQYTIVDVTRAERQFKSWANGSRPKASLW